MKMSKRKTYHVTPGTDGGWKVKEENASTALSKHDTKADAVNRAKEVAKNQDLGQVVIAQGEGKDIHHTLAAR